MKKLAILVLGLVTLGCIGQFGTGRSAYSTHSEITEVMRDLNLFKYEYGNYCRGDFSYKCDARYGRDCGLPDGITFFAWDMSNLITSYAEPPPKITINKHDFFIIEDDPNSQGGHYLWIETNCQGKNLRYDIIGRDPELTNKNREIMEKLSEIC